MPKIQQVLVLLALILESSLCRAGGFYLETGVGASNIHGGGAFFGTGAPDSTNFGFSYNAMLAKNLLSELSFMQIHLGAKARSNSSSSADSSLSMVTIYPCLRFEFPKLYFGGGLSPWIYKSFENPTTKGQLQAAKGTAYMLEAGLLWRVVYFFNLALEGSYEFVRSAAGNSPNAVITGSFQMRFYFTGNEERKKRKDFHGWRYPFGVPFD